MSETDRREFLKAVVAGAGSLIGLSHAEGSQRRSVMTKTLLLIHGAFAGGWCFDKFVGVFEDRGWTCHAADLRLHGRNIDAAADAELAELGIADYTREMSRFLESLTEPPIIIGHSMGTLIAQQLATEGRAKALVLLASCAPWGMLPSSDDELKVATGLMSAGPFWTKALHPVFEVAVSDSLASLDADAQRRVFDRFGPESGRALFELFFWMFDGQRASRIDSTHVTCPVLAITGSQDKVVSVATGRQVANLYGARGTFQEAPDHGHFLVLEKGCERLAQQCADWIEQN
jgi:non-heme chloroperoxidase